MKLQAALEYLNTYIWAILIIAVVFIVMIQLNVFNPNFWAAKQSPGSCTILRIQLGGATLHCTGKSLIPEFTASFSQQSATIDSAIEASVGSQPITSQITITFWADNSPACTSANACTYLHLSGSGGASCSGYSGLWITAGQSNLCTSAGSTSLVYPSPHTWAFYAITISPVIAIAYENAVATQQSGTIGSISISNIVMGDYNYPGSNNWDSYNGHLANVQIYNTSLSANQINSLYLEGIGGSPIDLRYLVGWWPLNGDSVDYSGYGNTGTSANVIFTDNWYNNYAQP